MIYFTVLKNLESDPLIKKYIAYLDCDDEKTEADFLGELFSRNAQDDFTAYLTDKALYDENAFSVAAAKKRQISEYIINGYKKDLAALYRLLAPQKKGEGNFFSRRPAKPPFTEEWDENKTVKGLAEFYAVNGYGDYIKYKAFRYESGNLVPVERPWDIDLYSLKDYAREKKLISDNIESFLSGLPYSDMLLYGERGTGKSSTVHAMLNKYFPDGLRIVELPKEGMLSLPALKRTLAANPLKFIIYIDDLSLKGGDERISSLKAALEGSVEEYSKNTMIVATSNRRHIVDEKFSSRDDSVHSGDSMQEELSLSDRFGLAVLFTTTTKEEYLSIVNQLAADEKIKMDAEKLDLLAEQWALKKGGRSPRRARQFIDLVIASESKRIPVEF